MTTQPTLPRQSKTGSANAATAATANTGSGRGLDVPVHASEPAKAARPAKAAVGAQSARSLPQTMQPASPAACAQSESVASCVAAHRASASFDGENDSSGAALWPRPPPALPLREHNKALVHTDASSAAGSNHHHNCGPSARAPACLVAQSQQPGQQPGQSDVCSPDLRCACPNSTETRSATATVPSTRRSTSSSSSSSSSSSTTSSRAATFKPATVAPAAASPSAPAPAPSPAARPPAEQTAPRSTRIPAMPQQHSGLLLSDDNHRMPSSAFTPVASCSVLGRAALVPHGGPSKRLQLKPPLQQTSPPPEPAATQPLLLNQPPARDPDGPDSPDGHLAAYRETGASHRGCSAPLAPERLAPTPAQTPAPDASAIPADACSSQHPACPPADTDPDTAMRSSCQEETVARSVAEFQTTADATVAAAGLTATATATATTTLAANMATATARSTPLLSLGLISLSEPNTAAQHSSRPVATPFSPKQRRARRLSGYSNACSQAEFSVQTTLPTATMAAGGLDDNNGVLKRPLAISATAHALGHYPTPDTTKTAIEETKKRPRSPDDMDCEPDHPRSKPFAQTDDDAYLGKLAETCIDYPLSKAADQMTRGDSRIAGTPSLNLEAEEENLELPSGLLVDHGSATTFKTDTRCRVSTPTSQHTPVFSVMEKVTAELAHTGKMAEKLKAWSQGDPRFLVQQFLATWELDISREHNFSEYRDREVYCGEINADVRQAVTNWMCEVSDEHRLQRKTFHMGVNYLDAYMAYLSHEVTLATFQLLAISCLFVAAKIEETISAPSLSNLVEFALQDDENKTAEDRPKKLADISKQYIEIEVKLMTIFDWDVLIPSTIDTLWGCFERHRMLTACRLGVEFVDFDMNGRQHVDAELFSQAASLLDHAVCDVESLKFSNSQLASCAFYRAVMSRESLFDYPSISVDVELVTGFTLVELEECLKFMDGFSISHITELVEARLAAMADQQRVLGLDPTNILYSQVNPFEVDAEDLQGDEQDDFGKG